MPASGDDDASPCLDIHFSPFEISGDAENAAGFRVFTQNPGQFVAQKYGRTFLTSAGFQVAH